MQTISTMNLRHYVPLAVTFNHQSANWRLYKCKCFRVLAVYLTPFSCVSAIIGMALSQARTFEWIKCLKDGQESVEDCKNSGRPSPCTTPEMIVEVCEVILEHRRQTVHEDCNRIGLSYGSCQHILEDELNMRRIAATFVPHLLKNKQQHHQLQVCTELQEAVRHDCNFLSRVITGDESWLYNYDLETKQ
jgi:hypothetical protein